MSHHCISLDCVEILQYLKHNPFSPKRISHHCKDCTMHKPDFEEILQYLRYYPSLPKPKRITITFAKITHVLIAKREQTRARTIFPEALVHGSMSRTKQTQSSSVFFCFQGTFLLWKNPPLFLLLKLSLIFLGFTVPLHRVWDGVFW